MSKWYDGLNSFNPWKGLLYRDKYEMIARGEIPVPVQARIDPTLKCPLSCKWCNSARYRGNKDELSAEHLHRVLEFIAHWGVKAVVWAGGGEPTYHPAFPELLRHNAELRMDAAILSNGAVHNPETAALIGKYCRWAGISVDAGTAETYTENKGCATFDLVTRNISIMAENSDGQGVGYKFLIAPGNQHEIFEACKVAKEIGAHDFIARPADLHHQGMTNESMDVGDFDILYIMEQFDKCHALETDSFHVHTITHKFNEDFSHDKPFSQCYGAPLRLHIATDGNVYFCDDQYYQEEYCIGKHYPDPSMILATWGGDKHKELLYGNTPSKCSTRCCISNCCVLCERVVVNNEDPMCMNYP